MLRTARRRRDRRLGGYWRLALRRGWIRLPRRNPGLRWAEADAARAPPGSRTRPVWQIEGRAITLPASGGFEAGARVFHLKFGPGSVGRGGRPASSPSISTARAASWLWKASSCLSHNWRSTSRRRIARGAATPAGAVSSHPQIAFQDVPARPELRARGLVHDVTVVDDAGVKLAGGASVAAKFARPGRWSGPPRRGGGNRHQVAHDHRREALEGSSSRTIFGSRTSARAMASICCSPPERAPRPAARSPLGEVEKL